MSWPTPFVEQRLALLVPDRIAAADAARQTATARAIVRRLASQPGLVLADEVGMGKTFVALAVATMAIWGDKGQRPVIVMVPPSVKTKWENDWKVFRSLCIARPEDREIRAETAGNALDLFRLLDDTPAKRARLIFLTHGAFHRYLQDPWVKMAILKSALHHAKLGDRREALVRFAPDILRNKGVFNDPELYRRLLSRGFEQWRETITEYGDDPGGDPVPDVLVRVLQRDLIDVKKLRVLLEGIPMRSSTHIDARLTEVRQTLNQAFQDSWRVAMTEARFRSPLLILDEAHHAKNPGTQLASLFSSDESRQDANELAGALKGRFERMLFLTATPFQLGHRELLEVVSRFGGIDWKSMPAAETEARFTTRRAELRAALDTAQLASADLDSHWHKLRVSDVTGDADAALDPGDVDAWWAVTRGRVDQPERVQQVVRAFERAKVAFASSAVLLRPWVVRHLRPRTLPSGTSRRRRLPGKGLLSDSTRDTGGLPIEDSALLPFLLAARAQAIVGQIARSRRDRAVYRATFAEGLASSYETFLETRDKPDPDNSGAPKLPKDPRLSHYLDRLRDSLPSEDAFAKHPKVGAVVKWVCDLWEAGEKTVVFVRYQVSGRILVKHISRELERRLWNGAAGRLDATPEKLRELARSWNDGFEPGRPLDRVLRSTMEGLLAEHAGLAPEERARVVDVVRRFVRTETFLGRFVDLTADDRPTALEASLLAEAGGQTLRSRVDAFVRFLTRRTLDEQLEHLDAVERIQPGPRYEGPSDGERHGTAKLVPSVRLANGAVGDDIRRRLLLGFNTPFLPEILVASSVMAEGVDLHLNCRHMVHHDLDWNPSVIEQRTGRIDRIGAKAEQVDRSIEVCLPYVGGTQDEKMYKVVMDRERWFQVVMGESYQNDELSTEEAAQRVPLPESVARELAMQLEVVGRPEGEA